MGEKKHKILVADDDILILRMMASQLEVENYSVFLASDGVEALEMARSYKPDLVLLDVMMPRMDGWTVLKQLRSTPGCEALPVIFLTAKNSAQDRVQGLELGAADYIAKPFSPEELMLRIERALGSVAREQGKPGAGANSSPQSKAALHGLLRHISLSALLSLIDSEQLGGILTLSNSAYQMSGQIVFRAGQALASRIEGFKRVRNEDAIYMMMGWKQGTFDFKVGRVKLEAQIQTPLTQILLEGARLMEKDRRLSSPNF